MDKAQSPYGPGPGFFGNNPSIPDTLAIEIQSGGTPVAVGQTGDMPIRNDSGIPTAITAGQIAVTLAPGQTAGIQQTAAEVVIETTRYSYFDPCYPVPPNPDTICIVIPSRSVLQSARGFNPRGDARPADNPYRFSSDGAIR